MAVAVYLFQFKAIFTALGSLLSSVQAFRAQRSGHSLQLLFYLVAAGALMFLTLNLLASSH